MSLDALVQAWGWALLNFLWQGLAVGGVAGLLLGLLRGAPPRWRYAVCGLALGACQALGPDDIDEAAVAAAGVASCWSNPTTCGSTGGYLVATAVLVTT